MQDGFQLLSEKSIVRWSGGGGKRMIEGLPVPGLLCTLLRLVCCGFPGPLLLGFTVGVPAVRRVILQANEVRENLSVGVSIQLFVDC
jgi:hypothetical protein